MTTRKSGVRRCAIGFFLLSLTVSRAVCPAGDRELAVAVKGGTGLESYRFE
jgi:hypothetical protein